MTVDEAAWYLRFLDGEGPLGVLYQDCYPGVTQTFFDSLHEVGVTDAEMLTYNFGCPALIASPSDIQQAVLQFAAAGVSRVTQMGFEVQLGSFSKIAQHRISSSACW